MKRLLVLSAVLFIVFPLLATPAQAKVEWRVYNTLKLDSEPRDVAISNDGQWVYVLTDQGKIRIYSTKGVLEDSIEVGNHVNQIKAGPRADILILNSPKRRAVQILQIDFIKKIDVSGSPFKGPAEAPVVIAVFSEFQ